MSAENGNQKLAVVTGAAHRLGRALAIGLAHRGYAIGLHYHRSQAKAEATAAEIQQMGGTVTLLPADLTHPSEIVDLFNRVGRLPQPLSVLVNSSAVMQRASLMELDIEQWDQTLSLNLRAPWLCSREAVRLMTPVGGVIINISDAGASQTWTNYPVYVISKTALEALTRLMARTFAPTIRINAIAPGLILPPEDLPPAEWQRLVNRLPLKRSGDPSAVVLALDYFLDNDYVTGQVITVDGGYQLT